MALTIIPVNNFTINPIDLWANQWLLLTAGDYSQNSFNTMTVAWGSFGNMWNKPFVQVVVRPTRYTYNFMEKYETFTLCAFPEHFRSTLELLGSRSGRDGDKIAVAGLHPISSTKVAAPSFSEAELIIECRKIYWDDFEPAHFLDDVIDKNYPRKDYHRIYFGEIMVISGEDKYMI